MNQPNNAFVRPEETVTAMVFDLTISPTMYRICLYPSAPNTNSSTLIKKKQQSNYACMHVHSQEVHTNKPAKLK